MIAILMIGIKITVLGFADLDFKKMALDGKQKGKHTFS